MQSPFKFHKLFVEGFLINDCNVSAISSIPVIQESHNRRVWFIRKEKEFGVNYFYPPFLNVTNIKQIMVFINGLILILISILRSRFRAVLVVDMLNLSISAAAVCAAKLTRTKAIGILTDLPSILSPSLDISKMSLQERISGVLLKKLIYMYNGYVFLTDQMNKLINKEGIPYCIIEGLVDIKMRNIDFGIEKQARDPRIILYSGGLYEKYGVKSLIEAFMLLSQTDIQLCLYGSGEMDRVIKDYCARDARINYFGVLPNEEIVKAQLKATLLVNPRPSKEEFTKYSFPSKNMEYMASGTPVVTTRLPGMPKEYNNYVFTFIDETVPGISKTLNDLLSIPPEKLIEMGQKGKAFVMLEKNNRIQARKILDLYLGM